MRYGLFRNISLCISGLILALSLLLPTTALCAPIALVQKVSATSTSTQNLSATLPSTVGAGNLIVVAVSGWPNLPAATPVSDSQGNSYAIAGSVLSSQGAYSALYYAANVKAGSTAVTVRTVAGGGQVSMVVAEFSGVDPLSPLDKAASVTGSGLAPSSGAMAPSQAGDLAIASGTHNGTTITSAGSGFTMIGIATEDSDTHQPLAMEYQVLSGSQSLSATFSLAASFPWTQNAALFRPAGQSVSDTTAPTVSAFSIPATASSLTVSITSFTASDNVGVTGYLITESATAPSATASGWTASAPTSYTVSAAGTRTLYAWAKDAAGNVSAAKTATVTVTVTVSDTTAPTVSAFSIPATASSLTVSITSFTASDNVGVTGYLITESATAPSATASGWTASAPTSYTVSAAGARTLYAWAKDAAGNVSTAKTATVTVTMTAGLPEPSGWFAGDMHTHRSCGAAPEALSLFPAKMELNNLSLISLLADIGSGEVQDATLDMPRVNGQDDPLSTPSRIMHWDAEWHWDPIYFQYPFQALGGHVIALGLQEAHQIKEEYTKPIFDWAHQQNGIAGFPHMQYLDNTVPQSLTCCTPLEYPVEVALGNADFISEDVVQSGASWPGQCPECAIQAYYRLLNCGFRPALTAGTDYPCNGGAPLGSLLTYVQIPDGQVSYRAWLDNLAKGRTVISRNGHNEFLDLKVNSSSGPGDEIKITGSGTVQVTITWTAGQSLSGTIELVQNGTVIASKQASASSGNAATLTASVNFAKSGWLAARRMGSDGHQVHTGAVFVTVDNAPVRASATDAQFYVQWMDNLLSKTATGGAWSSYFVTNRAEAQARYQAARTLYQQIAAEAGTTPTPVSIFTGQTPLYYEKDAAYELGTRFRSDVNGQITQVRIYTNSSEGGSHTVRIWRVSDGTVVAGPYSWNITAGTAGWKSYTLPAAVDITANTDYIVAVSNSSDRYYARSDHGFDAPIDNGVLHTFVGSGVFTPTVGAMPTSSWLNSNYFRDVVFVPR